MLTITFSDPETILALQRYKQYITLEDGVESASDEMDQICEGLVLACLDEHRGFAKWNKSFVKTQALTAQDATNIVAFPQAASGNAPDAEPAFPASARG
jgi:hypothetical protein